MKNFIKNFYETVKVPEIVNLATLAPQGTAVIVLVPGDTCAKGAAALGILINTTPEPPAEAHPANPTGPDTPAPPPPPPVLIIASIICGSEQPSFPPAAPPPDPPEPPGPEI